MPLNESTLRSRARSINLKIQKCGARNANDPSYGRYRVITHPTQIIVFGGARGGYDATLQEVANFLDRVNPFASWWSA